MTRISRRMFHQLAAGSALMLALPVRTSQAAENEWLTSTSLFGESRYGKTFERYDHVNPDAPKGGTISTTVVGTFDSFNPYIARGTAAAGFVSFGGGLLYDTLMEQSVDEPSTSHPLLADAYSHPDDMSSAIYRLNPAARWHDGKPITADDVIWTFNALKANSPLYGQYYANILEAKALSEREIAFTFDQKGNRELPHIIGDMPVLPKHWWEATDAQGRKRDIAQPILEKPLGSAAYQVESFRPGTEIVWSRVPDYWGAKLGVKVGRENFDRRKYIYFLDDNAAWQAFTKGGFQDIRGENNSRRWAQDYSFPAFTAGDLIKKEFETTSGEPMQGFALNMRRPQFQDRRVREALTYVYDFESMNRRLFFGLYKRTSSFFEGGELASGGLPQGKELEILEPFRASLPPELFTQEFKLPVYDTPQATRDNLRRASQLFKEAGWVAKGGKLVSEKTGEQFRVEIPGDDPTDERIAGPFIDNLKKLGIDATLRIVDTSQYINRTRSFDFDVVTAIQSQSQSPGNEQREYWSSKAADIPGSRNMAGIKDPVVDALVEKIIFATTREDLVATTHALDRVLLWNFYYIPQYHNPKSWIAYWNKFGMPETQPSYIGADTESWWIDPEKEKALAAKYKGSN